MTSEQGPRKRLAEGAGPGARLTKEAGSVKTIVTPFMSPTGNEAALKTALMLARGFKAHVDALYVPSQAFQWWTAEVDAMVAQELMDSARQAADEDQAKARSAFERVIADDNVPIGELAAGGPSVAWRGLEGDVADVVSQYGSLYDFCVVAQPREGGGGAGLGMVESWLTGARRPVLVAPPAPTPDFLNSDAHGWNILVAWNRTLQSAIAASAALPFLARAKEVRVLGVTTGTKQGPAAAELLPHLAAHGVPAEVKEVAPDDRSVGQILLAESGEFSADLLVMGHYSHTRIRELILGGVTRHVLDNAQLPVLMMH